MEDHTVFRSFSDKKSPRKSFRLKPPFTRHAISILICAACMLCATFASFLYQHIVPDNHANVALFYILALVIIARWTVGYGYGIACTLFSVIAINYLFTYPYYKLNFSLTGYPITFLLMSGITLILCTMTSHMTIQSEMIAEREKRLAEAEMEKMRANLLRAISHDLRTPLTGIIGAVDAINAGALDHPDYRARCIETLTLQSERLHTLLQNFLTLTSLDALRKTGEENDFLPVRPLSVVRSAVEVCRSAAEAAGIEIVVGECIPIEIFADSLLLQQALNNLISNAVFHSGTRRIEVFAARTDDGTAVDFCVRDFGCGIAAEHQERIFNRFYRVPAAGKKHNGSGIGLAIVKRIAQFHHGRVFVSSLPGKGAEFHLELPL